MEPLHIADKSFESRLIVGTGKFSSPEAMHSAIQASGAELATVALKRVDLENGQDNMMEYLDIPGLRLLPNTSGVRSAKEAVMAAQLGREALGTNWVKLEIHPDPKYLMPDPIETLEAAKELVNQDFVVLPYVHADPVLCKRLEEEAGTVAVMPLGSPIGSNQGLKMRSMLEIIIDQSNVPVVVDAGIGSPSQAAEAMEMGADAVLVNTAMAATEHPQQMAEAFSMAVKSGRMAYEARLAEKSTVAQASSPLTSFLEE